MDDYDLKNKFYNFDENCIVYELLTFIIILWGQMAFFFGLLVWVIIFTQMKLKSWYVLESWNV